MRKKVIFIILGIVLLVAILFIFVGRNKIKEKKARSSYSFLNVKKGDIRQTVNVDGTVLAVQDIDLRFQLSGIIKEINYKVGEKIKKGDVLARLKSTDQAIVVKQREAGLAQARASLNLKLAGASNEDIEIYKSKIENAKKNLETIKNSTEKDVENSKAKILSIQATLDEAVLSLETIKKQNKVDLAIAYENAKRTIDPSLLIIEKTLDTVNDFWENDTLDDLFSVKNIQYKVETDSKYSQVKSDFEIISQKRKTMDGTDYEAVDDLLFDIKNNLDSLQSFLDSVFNGLTSTITSSGFSQTSLEAYKTNVNNLRANVNTSIASIEGSQEAILQIKTKYDTSVKNAQALINITKTALDSARVNLNSVVSKAEVQNVQAENSLKLAKDEYALRVSTPREVDIAYLRAKVHEASALLEAARENLDKTALVSPVNGVITDIKFDLGELISSSNVFIEIVSNEKKVEADIPEIEIGKVSVNDETEITFDAFVDKVFTGKIISIDPTETNIQGTIYYKADIIFNDATSSSVVLPGMTADVDILTASKSDVLSLPKGAIKQDSASLGDVAQRSYYVEILKNDKIVHKNVEIGLVGDKRVEIVGGLNKSDRVVEFVLKNNP